MIATALGLVLAPGLGAAISPMAIVAMLLLLTSDGGRTKAVLFAIGVFVATFALAGLVLVVATTAQVHQDGPKSKISAAISLALGLLLIYFAFKQWHKRPTHGHTATSPKWMTSLDSATPAKTFVLGAALSLMNAKNIPIAIATVTTVVQLGAPAWVNLTAVVIFAALGTLGVIVPLGAATAGGAGAAEKLRETKSYLVQHNAVILAVVFLLLGAQTVGKAVGHLFG